MSRRPYAQELVIAALLLFFTFSAAEAQKEPTRWQLIGSGLWFAPTLEPADWDWSSREADSLQQCEALCPVYREKYECQSFFYRPAEPGERSGRCDLHNLNRAMGLRVEPDTIHGELKWDYYEKEGSIPPAEPTDLTEPGCGLGAQGACPPG
jgi:hypothetical protein